MSWEIRAGDDGGATHWAKWVDLEAASRWCEVLSSLVQRADNATLMGDDATAEALAIELGAPTTAAGGSRTSGLSPEQLAAWRAERLAAQQLRLVEFASALRGFARALDMDVFSLAPYATRRIAGDDGGRDYAGLYTSGDDRSSDFLGSWRAEAFRRLRAEVPEIREAVDVRLDLFPRVDFDASGDVMGPLSDVIDPDSGVDARLGIAGVAGGPWNPWSGWVVKWWRAPSWGAAHDVVEATALVPLSLSWEVLYNAARWCVSLRINRVLVLSAGYVGARNARLSKVLGGTGLPATVVEYSAALAIARMEQHLPPEVEQLMGAVGGAATALGGLAVGVVVGLEGLMWRLLPRATAYATDCWGRSGPEAVGPGASPFGPFLQPLSKSGVLVPPRAPTHDLVPLPEAFARLAIDPRWAEGVLGAPASGGTNWFTPLGVGLVGSGGGAESSSGGGALVWGLGGLALLRLLGGF